MEENRILFFQILFYIKEVITEEIFWQLNLKKRATIINQK